MAYTNIYPTNKRLTPRTIQFTNKTQVSTFQSPFTGTQQMLRWNGAWCEINATLSPLAQADAEEITAFLNGLYGQTNAFYFNLPSKFLIPASVSLTISANGTDFIGATPTPTVGKWGVDNNKRLVQFVSTSSVWPNLLPGSNTISPSTTGALFRLASSDTSYSVDQFIFSSVTIAMVTLAQ